MSLAIQSKNISEILLPDGKWYSVKDMYLDAYEYGFEDDDYDKKWFLEYQPEGKDGITGFRAVLNNGTITGPMSSIIAIKERK
jgi:hypothetical protein|tara:strand:+ start:463 stop:711 length:249 start_codon:yes stop_codon:yes gene_type:complete